MKKYSPKEIEPKWQKYWQQSNTYTANLNSDKPKYVAMSMFNYPSGILHVGHSMNYSISDIKARFKRQQGFESYHPIGWDSFGAPAENLAIKTGKSPQEIIADILPKYRKLYQKMGWSNDWEKEIGTHTPEYYKWTQWLFSQLYKNDLAYQEGRAQWWCEQCQSVLSDEQVLAGKCWRHDGNTDPLVAKKEVKQWFFRITDYADELLEATKDLNWTESVKIAQKNWIGRSEGAEIKFQVKGSKETITTFTTAHDTIFGATFMVLAPEHELVTKITTEDYKKEVQKYQKSAALKNEIERQANKDKTGVFTGSYAVNPINGRTIPIWVADYVLSGYGTGAIMAVPGEDMRDFEFAQKYKLDIIYTTEQQEFVEYTDIKSAPTKYKLANSGEFNGLDFQKGRAAILAKLEELKLGSPTVNYKMRDWSVSRQRYWGSPIPIIYCDKCGPVLVPDDQLPIILPELEDYAPSGDGQSALARATDWLKTECPDCGADAQRETETLDGYVCSSWYMYRYLDPHNQEAIFDSKIVNKWAPIDFYNGGDHATAHLLYARFIARFLHKIGLINNPEPFDHMLYNGKVRASDGSEFSKRLGNGPDPLEIIESGYGADALRTYLMFAAPLELNTNWDPGGVPGTYRFLNRTWNLVQEFLEVNSGLQPDDPKVELSPEIKNKVLTASHRTAKKVTEDIESGKFNTAIATMMECVNTFFKIKVKAGGHLNDDKDGIWRMSLMRLLATLAPFAPHITEELWQDLGISSTIHIDTWPKWEDQYITDDQLTIVVQVNGKVRSELQVSTDSTEKDILELAKQDPKITSWLSDKTIIKEIYVPNKLVNIVV